MSIAMMMAMASCSSSDDAVAENNTESKLVQMTFTATQESNVSTRTALTSERNVIWKSGDAISVFDNTNSGHNHKFILSSGDGNTTGSFTGEVEASSSLGDRYISVYPFTEGAELGKAGELGLYYVSDMMLPSTQTAIKDSFDPAAALMIAESSDKNQIDFKNVVSLVKIKTEFDCKRIVLNANEYIAGKGKLYAKNDPDIEFISDQSTSIVLKPATEGGDIEAGTYYIAVKPGTLTAGWSISFTSTDYNVYTRKANNGVTFNRSKIRSIGSFNAESTLWTSTSRGDKVSAGQEVDLGLTITKEDGKKYRVIFANANLTTTGLAASETAYGDYYAWGATEPWYTAITETTVSAWKTDKSGGYTFSNAKFYTSGSPEYSNLTYSKYNESNKELELTDDAAHQKLGGDWQIPTKDIWTAFIAGTNNYYSSTDHIGMRFTSKTNGNSIFLPCSGNFDGVVCNNVDVWGLYWSNTSYNNTNTYLLTINSSGVNKKNESESYEYESRFYGFTIRPVRLVDVTE